MVPVQSYLEYYPTSSQTEDQEERAYWKIPRRKRTCVFHHRQGCQNYITRGSKRNAEHYQQKGTLKVDEPLSSSHSSKWTAPTRLQCRLHTTSFAMEIWCFYGIPTAYYPCRSKSHKRDEHVSAKLDSEEVKSRINEQKSEKNREQVSYTRQWRYSLAAEAPCSSSMKISLPNISV